MGRRDDNAYNIEDRHYSTHEFYGCAVKYRHLDWWSALMQAKSLKKFSPATRPVVYDCIYCGGLHITSGKTFYSPWKLKRTLRKLERDMASPNYAKAPSEVKARQAELVQALRKRLAELDNG